MAVRTESDHVLWLVDAAITDPMKVMDFEERLTIRVEERGLSLAALTDSVGRGEGKLPKEFRSQHPAFRTPRSRDRRRATHRAALFSQVKDPFNGTILYFVFRDCAEVPWSGSKVSNLLQDMKSDGKLAKIEYGPSHILLLPTEVPEIVDLE